MGPGEVSNDPNSVIRRVYLTTYGTLAEHIHLTARPQDFTGMVHVVAAAAMWSAAAWPALPRACGGPYGRCRAHERSRTWLGSGSAVILWSGQRRPAVLAACNPSIVQWVVCVTTSMVQDA